MYQKDHFGNRSSKLPPNCLEPYDRYNFNMEKETFQNSAVTTGGCIDNFDAITSESSWLERKLKRSVYKPRYLFIGKPLLWMTCFFGSLGDALFGYDQGKTEPRNKESA
jgi:hypothetical protein